jgi:hypothetical protein
MFGIKQINIKVKMLSFSFLEYNKIIYMTLITNIYIYMSLIGLLNFFPHEI